MGDHLEGEPAVSRAGECREAARRNLALQTTRVFRYELVRAYIGRQTPVKTESGKPAFDARPGQYRIER
jgi:hypothetical protein